MFFNLAANGHVYEMFGNSKHYSVQPPLLYKPAEMSNKPLTAKYFIYDVAAIYVPSSRFALLTSLGPTIPPLRRDPYTNTKSPKSVCQSVCQHLILRSTGYTFLPINHLTVSGSK